MFHLCVLQIHAVVNADYMENGTYVFNLLTSYILVSLLFVTIVNTYFLFDNEFLLNSDFL